MALYTNQTGKLKEVKEKPFSESQDSRIRHTSTQYYKTYCGVIYAKA